MLTSLLIALTNLAAIEGTWRTEGYGLLISIQGSNLQVYEETTISCLPSLKVTRQVSREDGPTEFRNDDGAVLQISTPSANRLRVGREGTASDIFAQRIPGLPGRCSKKPANTPLTNFDIFARTFSDHYILFEDKGIDWPRVVAGARAKVTSRTTPTELFDILKGMIAPLHDAHVSLSAPALKLRAGFGRQGTDSLLQLGSEQFRNVEVPRAFEPTAKMLKGPLRSWCEGQVWSGWIDDSTGYLRLLSFSGYSTGPTYRDELANLEIALDSVLVPGLKRLVIDVRINMGGADPLGLAIASRLATAEYVAYVKEARSDPNNRKAWTPGQPSRVVPAVGRRTFRGPVAILTSGLTISAGETFTQAMMGRQPAVFRIGEPTQGVFSDVLGRRLPNGFRFGLPNEVFRTLDGKTFDGPGIPPTHPVPVFSTEDRRSGRDGALEKALELLRT